MGLSLRIFPGVRVGVSSRGFNASVGPRIARVHAGPGGVRYSSSFGPLTVSGGGRRRRYSSSQANLNLEAFEAAMEISPEQRESMLQEQISRHEKKGWKVIGRGEGFVRLERVSRPVRSVLGVTLSGLTLPAALNGGLIPLLNGQFDMKYWWGLVLNLLFTTGLAMYFWFELRKFFTSGPGALKKVDKKGIRRRIEVSTWGLVHRQFHD